jgi:hypothetical protein
MDLGTPCNLNTSFIYNGTNSSAELVIFIGMKCADLVSRSTTTHIASLPQGVRGKPTIKSIVMCSHFRSGISRGFNKPACPFMLSLHHLTNTISCHILGNIKLHPFPPEVLLEISIHLGLTRMNGVGVR